MKKPIALLLGIILILSLAACAQTPPTAPSGSGSQAAADSAADSEKPDGADAPGAPGAKSKTLVVYFSASGNTKRVAEDIAQATGAALFELVPAEPYTAADLSWTTPESRVNREHDDESLRDVALIAQTPENFEEYDTVFIGYPIWWGIAAWPVNGFVKNNDFTGKTVIPFATSASSGLGQSGALLAGMAGTGSWREGQRFSSGASRATVEAWVSGLEGISR